MESPNPFSREAFLAPASSHKPSKTPRSKRSKRRFAGAIGAALLVGIGASFLVSHLIREHRRNPYATMQNGLILRAIHASDYEPFHKNTDAVTYESHYPTIEIELPRGAHVRSVQGRASTGDVILLERGTEQALPENLLDMIWGNRQSVVINLPQFGVPASFEWVDVTVEDDRKRRGTWRVYGLPTLQNTISNKTPLRETASGPRGIRLSARAWREASNAQRNGDTINTTISCEVKVDVPASAITGPQQLWAVDIQSDDLEWQPPSAVDPFADARNTYCYFSGPLIGPGTFYASTLQRDVSLSPRIQRFARIQARLVRYDTAIESVTFHDIPLAVHGKGRKIDVSGGGGSRKTGPTLTTPSGVRVELESPYSFSGSRGVVPPDNHKPNDVAIAYQTTLAPNFRAGASVTRVVSSVLSEKNAYAGSKNGFAYASPQENTPSVRVALFQEAYLLGVKNVEQSVLPSLTISTARQTEREAIPFTFIVPIQATPTDRTVSR